MGDSNSLSINSSVVVVIIIILLVLALAAFYRNVINKNQLIRQALAQIPFIPGLADVLG